jgi:hypothetical protein
MTGEDVKQVVIKLNNKCLLFNEKCASVGVRIKVPVAVEVGREIWG